MCEGTARNFKSRRTLIEASETVAVERPPGGIDDFAKTQVGVDGRNNITLFSGKMGMMGISTRDSGKGEVLQGRPRGRPPSPSFPSLRRQKPPMIAGDVNCDAKRTL